VALTRPPDLSSANWITEAPTACAQLLCFPVPLQNFGSLSFSGLAALGNGIGGTLARPDWTLTSLRLTPSTVLALGPSNADATAGAIPGGLDMGGDSFRVFWVANPSSAI
jgi:hypothetical protein